MIGPMSPSDFYLLQAIVTGSVKVSEEEVLKSIEILETHECNSEECKSVTQDNLVIMKAFLEFRSKIKSLLEASLEKEEQDTLKIPIPIKFIPPNTPNIPQ